MLKNKNNFEIINLFFIVRPRTFQGTLIYAKAIASHPYWTILLLNLTLQAQSFVPLSLKWSHTQQRCQNLCNLRCPLIYPMVT